jgi:hypothetical protein
LGQGFERQHFCVCTMYYGRFSACERCEWARICVTVVCCMVLVKYAVRTGLFGECNVAEEITKYVA